MNPLQFLRRFSHSLAMPIVIGVLGSISFWLYYRFIGGPFQFSMGYVHLVTPVLFGLGGLCMVLAARWVWPRSSRAVAIVASAASAAIVAYIAIVLTDRMIVSWHWTKICYAPEATNVESRNWDVVNASFSGRPIPRLWRDTRGTNSGPLQLAAGCDDSCFKAIFSGREVLAGRFGPLPPLKNMAYNGGIYPELGMSVLGDVATEFEFGTPLDSAPQGPFVWFRAPAASPLCRITHKKLLLEAKIAEQAGDRLISRYFRNVARAMGADWCVGHRPATSDEIITAYRKYVRLSGLYSQDGAAFFTLRRPGERSDLLRAQEYHVYRIFGLYPEKIEWFLGPTIFPCGADPNGVLGLLRRTRNQ